MRLELLSGLMMLKVMDLFNVIVVWMCLFIIVLFVVRVIVFWWKVRKWNFW